jgi:hypothetical protein
MRVYTARKNKFSGSVYFPVGGNCQVAANGTDRFAFNKNIGRIIIGSGNDVTVFNK